jgi:hypothetical protein
MTTFRLAAYGVIFSLCCFADVFVLRTALTGLNIADGQFRRGYFEQHDSQAFLAIDNAIRPDMIPAFSLSDLGEMTVPPGMIAVAPLLSATTYRLASDSAVAPYMVIGEEAPVGPARPGLDVSPGEARLANMQTLDLRDARLALIEWNATLPWQEDAARLSALRDACMATTGRLTLTISVSESTLDVQLGKCFLHEPRPSPAAAAPLLATLAGPAWASVARQPGWVGERWVIWQAVVLIAAKVAALWWALGAPSAVAVSGALGLAALYVPVPAILTWPLTLVIAIGAAVVRLLVIIVRRLPARRRLHAALAALVLVGLFVISNSRQSESYPPFVRDHADNDLGDECTLVGYSTVKGEGLRRETGGVRSLVDRECAPCREKTGGIFAGGETLAWARDAYCATAPTLGERGLVTFLGSVNDDFFWGKLSLPRLFVVGQQGGQAWQESIVSAAQASFARLDEQAAAIEGLMQCVRTRGGRFLYLHDFLVTDLGMQRSPERAAMLERRRDAVTKGGGTFVDLSQVFAADAGISWFNDYVHLSTIAHERVADLVCGQFAQPDAERH